MKFGCVEEEGYMSYMFLEVYGGVVDCFYGFVDSLSMVYEYCVVASSLQIQNNRVATIVHRFLS